MTELRRKQEIAFRRNLIIEAAKSVFFEKGFNNSTMDDIAQKAGYSKGSLYSYFNGKNEICFAIVNEYYSDIEKLVRSVSASGNRGLQKLVMVRDAFLNEYVHNSQFCNIYETFKCHRSQCSEMENEIALNREYNDRIANHIMDIIQSGIKDGSIKSGINTERLSKVFWNKNNCLFADTMFSDEDAYNYLFDIIIDSIKTTEDV